VLAVLQVAADRLVVLFGFGGLSLAFARGLLRAWVVLNGYAPMEVPLAAAWPDRVLIGWSDALLR